MKLLLAIEWTDGIGVDYAFDGAGRSKLIEDVNLGLDDMRASRGLRTMLEF